MRYLSCLKKVIDSIVARRRGFLMILLSLFLLLSAISCQALESLESMMDSDGDGWTDAREGTAGTDPGSVDSDDDGYWDPLDPNPLDPSIPPVEGGLATPTPALTATPTPAPTATATPASTPIVSLEKAAAEELHKVQTAVAVMMRSNNLTELEHPVTIPSNDMRRFPDGTTTHGNAGVGYVLFCHDFNGDGKPDVNYIHLSETKGTYVCDRYGHVTQVTAGYE